MNKKFLKFCIQKYVNNKRKSVSGMKYIHFPVLHTHNKMFIFLTDNKPIIKTVQYGIIPLLLIFLFSYVLIFLLLLNKYKKYILHID